MTRDDWKAYEQIQYKPDVKLAQQARCEEQGHDWENCCSVLFQIYQACKWCGATR
jgi:hypothetical protein